MGLTATPHIVLGTLQGSEKDDFIMVVNRRIDMEQDVALRFDLTARPVGKVERLGKQTGEWVELVLFDAKKLDEQAEWAALHSFRRRGTWAVELTVGAGDGELLRIRQDRGE